MKKKLLIVSLLCLCNGIAFAQNNNCLLKDSCLLDMEFLCEKLQETHPDPFMNVSYDRFVWSKDSICKAITDCETDGDFYFKVASLLSMLKDGHTSVTMPKFKSSRNLRYGNKIFPMDVKVIDGKLYSIYDNFVKDSIYDEMELINNISVDSLMKKIVESYSFDKYPDICYTVIENSFFMLFNELCGADSIYSITYKGKPDKYVTQGLSYEKLLKLSRYSTIPQHYKVDVNDEKNEAYIKFSNFYPSDKIYNFIDSAFCLVGSKHVDTLVIDIRGNKGGSSDVIEQVMNNLTTDEYKIFDSVQVKVSDYTKRLYQRKDSLSYQKIKLIENGNIFEITPDFIHPSNKIVYNGKLIVLTDKSTYSGAATFAHLIKTMQRGEVLNETGGNDIYFGDYAFYTLPYSKLNVAIAAKKFFEWRSRKSK